MFDLLNDQPIVDDPPPRPDGTTHNDELQKTLSYREYVEPLGAAPGQDTKASEPRKGPRNNYRRRRRARDAVLVRAANQCENDRCTGMPPDITASGAAILEVDHVDDLAFGGPDHPSSMIALCPNCHAAKTRGRHRAALRRHLRARAAKLHRDALAAPG